ncbi:MAG: GGDEF domain-containing response regulator [Pseudomonadota bacterium]
MANKREELSIVVVDDMKFSCEFIRRALSAEGYGDIRIAGSAEEALELLEKRPADVLLADWVMPGMDGLALTARIRQIDEESNHYTCVLLLTARDDIDSVIEAFDRGVDDYLTKPPNKQELAARVHAAGRTAAMQNGLLDTIEHLRLEAERRTTIDALTGLGNRLDAERRFDELLQLVARRGGALCCGYLALHNGAALRRERGEAGYDELLQGVARRMRRLIRPGDVVARISDEEFVVGMHYLDDSQIKGKTFKRIMQGINLRPFKVGGGFVTVTVAMGMCCNREGDAPISAEQLLECAGKKVKTSVATGCTEVAV